MKKLFVAALLLTLSVCAYAQQDYVGRYDVFAGFSYLDSPKLNLQQRGVNTQIGVNVRRWLAMGVDYSIQFGRASLVPNDLKPQFATPLNALVAAGEEGAFAAAPPLGFGISLPSNYVLSAPFDASTQTFTAGPQLAYRHFKKVTLFAHPSIGAIHENISIHPHDAFTQYIVLPALLGQLPAVGATTPIIRTLKPNDTTYFYGLGGGVDYNLTKHFHLRADVEFVHVFLFSDLLKDSRNSVRLSVGPAFNFGKNVSR
jgi:opacity protein-like surface antigen